MNEDRKLTPEQAEPILKMITRDRCQFCGSELSETVDAYDHADGWTVKGIEKKQWLSIKCTNKKCGYDWSLWKLGVPRE